MTSSEERCPTCDGSGFVMRGDQRLPCPTCSPTNSTSEPYLARNGSGETLASRVFRWAAYIVGAAALVAAIALLIKLLWH
jgi:hypothetical protein